MHGIEKKVLANWQWSNKSSNWTVLMDREYAVHRNWENEAKWNDENERIGKCLTFNGIIFAQELTSAQPILSCTWHTSISMFYTVCWHWNCERQVIANKQRENGNFWCGIKNYTYYQTTLWFQPSPTYDWHRRKLFQQQSDCLCRVRIGSDTQKWVGTFTVFKTRFSLIWNIVTAFYS